MCVWVIPCHHNLKCLRTAAAHIFHICLVKNCWKKNPETVHSSEKDKELFIHPWRLKDSGTGANCINGEFCTSCTVLLSITYLFWQIVYLFFVEDPSDITSKTDLVDDDGIPEIFRFFTNHLDEKVDEERCLLFSRSPRLLDLLLLPSLHKNDNTRMFYWLLSTGQKMRRNNRTFRVFLLLVSP